MIAVLQRTTQLKAGECIGVVFTGFYGLGILLLKHIQNNAARYPGQAGLDKFLFGQIAGISATDVIYMAVVAAVSLACVAARRGDRSRPGRLMKGLLSASACRSRRSKR